MPVHPFDPASGKLATLTIESAALRGNLLGDPSRRTVAVYLPPGYDDSDVHYPLVVDLAGYTGSGLKHVGWRGFGESVPQRIDRLVATGAMGPVVAVFPDGFTSLGGNQYIDSIVLGRWEELPDSTRCSPGSKTEYRVMPRDRRIAPCSASPAVGTVR